MSSFKGNLRKKVGTEKEGSFAITTVYQELFSTVEVADAGASDGVLIANFTGAALLVSDKNAGVPWYRIPHNSTVGVMFDADWGGGFFIKAETVPAAGLNWRASLVVA